MSNPAPDWNRQYYGNLHGTPTKTTWSRSMSTFSGNEKDFTKACGAPEIYNAELTTSYDHIDTSK